MVTEGKGSGGGGGRERGGGDKFLAPKRGPFRERELSRGFTARQGNK